MIPGGVNSPVRAFKAVGGTPLFIRNAEGARVWDADGRAYLDYLGSWGPMILGHAFAPVVEAVQQAAARGTSYGAPCALEVELADRVVRMVPSIDKVRNGLAGNLCRCTGYEAIYRSIAAAYQ